MVHWLTSVSALFFLAASLVACSGVPYASVADTTAYKVVVEADHAELIFPAPSAETLRWYRPDTPANRLEYAWYAEIRRPGDGTHNVGFYLFKSAVLPPRDGSLLDLIAAGQLSAGLQHGNRMRPVWEMEDYLSIEVREDVIVVRIEGDAATSLFDHRPSAVRLHTVWPGRERAERSVRVDYAADDA